MFMCIYIHSRLVHRCPEDICNIEIHLRVTLNFFFFYFVIITRKEKKN